MAKAAQISPALTVTEVEIVPVKPHGGLVAFASCLINGCLYVGNVGIHTRPDGSGYRLLFPDKTLPNGVKIQCFHPTTREAHDVILQAIVRKFEALTASVQCDEDVIVTSKQRGGSYDNDSAVS